MQFRKFIGMLFFHQHAVLHHMPAPWLETGLLTAVSGDAAGAAAVCQGIREAARARGWLGTVTGMASPTLRFVSGLASQLLS